MATYFLCPLTSILQYFTDVGVVLAGGKVYTYIAGSSTPTVTYTDSTGGTPNANPIILNAAGRLPSVMIWQPQTVKLKIIIQDANGNQIGPTFDQIAGINDIPASNASIFNAYRTTSQNLPASTKTTLIFDTASINPQSSYNASNGVFTAPAAGTYLFTASALLENNAINNGILNAIYISKNNADSGAGSVVYIGSYFFGTTLTGAGNAFPNTGSVTLTLALNDTVRVKVDAGAGFGGGGQFNFMATSYFSGLLIPGT